MFEYSDYDGWADWEERLSQSSYERFMEERPTCVWCGEKITDQYAYFFPDGDVVCEECVDEYVRDHFRENID